MDDDNDTSLDKPFVPDFPITSLPEPFENVAENVTIDSVKKRDYSVNLSGGKHVVTKYSTDSSEYIAEAVIVKMPLNSSLPRSINLPNINNNTGKPVTNVKEDNNDG